MTQDASRTARRRPRRSAPQPRRAPQTRHSHRGPFGPREKTPRTARPLLARSSDSAVWNPYRIGTTRPPPLQPGHRAGAALISSTSAGRLILQNIIPPPDGACHMGRGGLSRGGPGAYNTAANPEEAPRMDELNPQKAQMADESMVRTLRWQTEAVWPQEAPILRSYGLPPKARILDAGCGTGEASRRLAELFPSAT